MMKRILIADSEELSRKALVELIRTQPDCRVVTDLGTATETLAACRTEPHDVLIVDTHVPPSLPESGNVIREILKHSPGARLIALVPDVGQTCLLTPGVALLTGTPTLPCCRAPDCPGSLFVQGVSCVISRAAKPAMLFRAIRQVAADRSCFTEEFTRRVVGCVSRCRSDRRPALSARERQVAALVARGLCNKEIATELGVGVAAVKKHMGNLLRKLQIQDRLQLGLLIDRDPDLTAPEG